MWELDMNGFIGLNYTFKYAVRLRDNGRTLMCAGFNTLNEALDYLSAEHAENYKLVL